MGYSGLLWGFVAPDEIIMYHDAQMPGGGAEKIFSVTSLSLWFRIPRTKSCKFLSSTLSRVPLTFFRAIMSLYISGRQNMPVAVYFRIYDGS